MSRTIDHFTLVYGEARNSTYKNLGDIFDEMHTYRDFDLATMYFNLHKEDRQKDMGPENPEYHWDWLEARYCDA